MDHSSSSQAISGNVGVVRLNWHPTSTPQHRIWIVALEASDAVANVEQVVGTFVQDGASDTRSVEKCVGDVGEIRGHLSTHADEHVIFVVDDPVSLALSWESAGFASMPKALTHAATAVDELCRAAADRRAPSLLISAHRSALYPAPTLDALATFCGVHPSHATRSAAQSLVAGGTQDAAVSIPDQPIIQGALDRAQKPGFIRGWAKLPLSDHRVHVQVLRDGKVVGDGIADRLRDDLIVHRVGDGRHGFLIDVGEHLSVELQDFVVQDAKSGALVGRVSMSVESAVGFVDIEE